MITAPTPSLPFRDGTERFPLHRIFCVGRNYAEHAREMGHDAEREEPFFFLKPASAAFAAAEGVAGGEPGVIPYPARTRELHHEVELVVALGAGGSDLEASQALDLVAGYAVGLDLTRRDVQATAKQQRRPWDMAKGFDASAPCSPLAPVAEIGHPSSGMIGLDVDGAPRQRGDLSQQIWSVSEILAELSSWVALVPGDVIMTGTPAGVGPLEPGERVRAFIDGVGQLEASVGPRA